MNRVAACVFVLICASPLACSSHQYPVTAGWDGKCDSFGIGETAKVEVTLVNGKPAVDRECILIMSTQSDVEWTGPAGMKLEVTFKDSFTPKDPVCSNNAPKCTLAKADAKKKGFWFYNIIVTPQGGEPIKLDPRLIIQP